MLGAEDGRQFDAVRRSWQAVSDREVRRLLKKISISLVLLLLVGLAAWFAWSPLEKASGGEEDVSRAAAKQFSQKWSELASPPKGHFSKAWEFSQKEMDSYLRYELAQSFPKGLRDVRIKFLVDSLSADAFVNFDEMQTDAKNPFLSALLAGEHRLELVGKLNTQDKTGTYDILVLRLDQKEIPKPLVDLLIAKLVVPKYPSAKPNTPFELPYDITRIDIQQGKMTVYQSGS
jgi:hypothetical protein